MASVCKVLMLLLCSFEINVMLGFCKPLPSSFCPTPGKKDLGSEIYNYIMKWIFSADHLEPRGSDFISTKNLREKGEIDHLEPRGSDFISTKNLWEKGETDHLEPRGSDFISTKNLREKGETGRLELKGSDFTSPKKIYPEGTDFYYRRDFPSAFGDGFPGLAPLPDFIPYFEEIPVINREDDNAHPVALNDQQRRVIQNFGRDLRGAADEWDHGNSHSTEERSRVPEVIRNIPSALYQVLISPIFRILNLDVVEEFIEDWFHSN